MRRAIPIVLAGLALSAWTLGSLSLPSLPQWMGGGVQPQGYLGYVEGETTLVGPPFSGRLIARPVARGDAVKAGDRLFSLDPAGAQAEVARLEASAAAAKATLENLRTGKREIEQEVVRAQRRETDAALVMAEKELARARDLTGRGVAAQSRLDQAQSQVDQLKAKAQQLKAQEAVGDLGARAREIEAAEANARAAEAALAESKVRLRDVAPVAPADGYVENTFYEVGEWVGSGQPVVSLLTTGRVKLRFFVPEGEVARAKPGGAVSFTCDGCNAERGATISYVSPRAEYTPPVIYSVTARAKLVFLVEARPAEGGEVLRPGLPVTVRLVGDGR